MEWVIGDVAESAEEREDGGKNLMLLFNATTDRKLDGANFTCRIITRAGNMYQESVKVEVKGEYIW